MSYFSRNYRQRNAHTHDEMKQQPFFSKQHDTDKSSQKSAFFQTKLSVNAPGDSYEHEADSVASAVVNKASQTPIVQQKKISSIQRLSTPIEDEKLGTNDARMEKDKEIQEKPIQRMDMEGPDKEKEEMMGVQKMDDPMKEEDKMKMMGSSVQMKHEGGASTASHQVSMRITNSSGKGNSLSKNTLREMNSSFGVNFSNVRVHFDSDAISMSKELQAQAFTYGNDIYFNSGKYNPESAEGKFLLAHELTHVVQQGGVTEKENRNTTGSVHGTDQNKNGARGISNRVEQSMLQRDDTDSPTPEEIRQAKLRSLSTRPGLALGQWSKLNQADRDQVLWNITASYGADFATEFMKYANGSKAPRIGPPGALKGPQYTEKYMFDHGFRHAYDQLWVHPSGEEIMLLPPATKQDDPAPDDDDREKRCSSDCVDNSSNQDECDSCCDNKFPDQEDCRRFCKARCET